jgi:elongation factor P
MIHASDIKEGMTLNIDDRLYKVLEVHRHTGSGKMQGFIEFKVLDLAFGHVTDKKFKFGDRVENVEVAKRQMDFLYGDETDFYFMDPESFEQYAIPRQSVGPRAVFLRESMRLVVELRDDAAIGLQIPGIVELAVTMTGAPAHGGQDSTMKSAVLENGIEILVPQFIQSGDHIRVDTDKARYVERVTQKHM